MNQIGPGEFSDPNEIGESMQEVPSVPTDPPILISQSETSITLEMPELFGADTGGSPILSYNLQYNQGGSSSNFVSVIGESPPNLLLTITKGGLNTNTLYRFQYRVQNKLGWSDGVSPQIEVRSATYPS